MFLIKNGVRDRVAFSLSEVTLDAWYLIFRELDGDIYDWDEERFLRPKEKMEVYKREGLVDSE